MRFGKLLLVLLVAVVAFYFGIYYQQRNSPLKANNPGESENGAAAGVTVRVTHPHKRDMYETVRATGTLEPIEKTDIFAKVPGEIVDVFVEEGERVKAKQLLAEIDDKELKLNLRQAQAAYRQASVNYKNISATWERNKKLHEEELISRQQYEQVQAQYRVAQSQVNSASVVLQEAKLNLSYTKVRAPMDGVVTFRDCEKYQRLTTAERLFEVARLDLLQVKVRITEKELPAVKGTKRPVKVMVEALKDTPLDREFEGRLSFISPVIDSASGTTEVRIELPGKDGLLTSGMFTRIIIETRLHLQALAIPKQALLGEEGDYNVFVIKPDEQGNPMAHRAGVKTGLADDKFVELIGGGLTESDWVVVEGQNLLSEKDAVIFASPEEGDPTPAGFSPQQTREASSNSP